MNLFYDLPNEIQDTIWYEVHKSFLKELHIEIKYGWPLCRKMIYKNRVYTHLLNSEMSNETIKVFNEYLDYKKGKGVYIPQLLHNVYIKLDPFIF
mgnify:CR=1 FL=1|jgi:hypothetical protein|tara:strand:+ start:2419 stop:2703 length:285 start_codon:yes stop_codon:yes gene_type:complete